jgi:mRNA-degrading endonuclease YafQ of YafQ-DinJ toxin-antitoxin module
MNSENGSPTSDPQSSGQGDSAHYNIVLSGKFERAIKALKKSYKSKQDGKTFAGVVANIVQGLTIDPRPGDSRLEPWPSNLRSDTWEFRKLVFTLPGRKGASAQGRLMYLVSDSLKLLQLVWIYTHEEFQKRPPDKDLKGIMQELLDNQDQNE